jgi:hypothetical protein
MEVAATADGVCNAILIWFEADLGGGHRLSSWHACSSRGSEGDDGGSSGGGQRGGGQRGGSEARCDPAGDASHGTAFAMSWSQGLHYLDGVPTNQARTVSPLDARALT